MEITNSRGVKVALAPGIQRLLGGDYDVVAIGTERGKGSRYGGFESVIV